MAYTRDEHGEIVLLYRSQPDSGWRYVVTTGGFVLRCPAEIDISSPDVAEFETYYTVDPGHIPRVVQSVRDALWQEVLVDLYGDTDVELVVDDGGTRTGTGPGVPAVHEDKTKETQVATKETVAPTIVLPPDKPLRTGAKAKKLLDQLDLPKAKREKLIADATRLARRQELPGGKSETILRDYYLYLAAEIPMPPVVQRQWEHFQKNGTELPASNAKAKDEDSGKARADGKKVARSSAKRTATPPTGDEDETL